MENNIQGKKKAIPKHILEPSLLEIILEKARNRDFIKNNVFICSYSVSIAFMERGNSTETFLVLRIFCAVVSRYITVQTQQ